MAKKYEFAKTNAKFWKMGAWTWIVFALLNAINVWASNASFPWLDITIRSAIVGLIAAVANWLKHK